MIQTAPQSIDRRSGLRRWWWVVIPLAFMLAAVGLVVIATKPKPFDGHSHFVDSVTTGELDGIQVVVSGGSDGTIRVWDLATGEPIREPVDVDVTITKVLLTELGGVPIIVSGTFDWQIQVWDLATAVPLGEPIGGAELRLDLVDVSNVAGVPAAITLVHSEPDYLQLWDLATGEPAGEPIGQDAGDELVAAAVGQVRGQEVVAAIDDGGTVRIWDLATGEPVGTPLRTREPGSHANVRLGDLHGTPLVITGSSHGDTAIEVRNLDTGERIGTFHSGAYLSALELGEVDGDMVIVAGHFDEVYYDDKLIWVWDLATGELLTEPFGDTKFWPWEDDYGISDLTVAELHGAPVVVSGGYDTMIRVWDLRTGDLLVGTRGRPWAR